MNSAEQINVSIEYNKLYMCRRHPAVTVTLTREIENRHHLAASRIIRDENSLTSTVAQQGGKLKRKNTKGGASGKGRYPSSVGEIERKREGKHLFMEQNVLGPPPDHSQTKSPPFSLSHGVRNTSTPTDPADSTRCLLQILHGLDS
jgi:hypothetical protein